MRNLTKVFAMCVAVATLFALHANGQNVNAGLGGTVTDASGAVIPGVAVTVTGIETGVQTSTITNEAGAYQFPSLQSGKYRASAALPGFQESKVESVTLGVGAQIRLNFTLVVSGGTTNVEVAVADSPLLATTATIGGVITGKEILDLTDLTVLDTGSNSLPALADVGIHVAAFLGDTNGDGRYNAPDAILLLESGAGRSGAAAWELAAAASVALAAILVVVAAWCY